MLFGPKRHLLADLSLLPVSLFLLQGELLRVQFFSMSFLSGKMWTLLKLLLQLIVVFRRHYTFYQSEILFCGCWRNCFGDNSNRSISASRGKIVQVMLLSKNLFYFWLIFFNWLASESFVYLKSHVFHFGLELATFLSDCLLVFIAFFSQAITLALYCVCFRVKWCIPPFGFGGCAAPSALNILSGAVYVRVAVRAICTLSSNWVCCNVDVPGWVKVVQPPSFRLMTWAATSV